jgi:hypothetical protein
MPPTFAAARRHIPVFGLEELHYRDLVLELEFAGAQHLR